MLQKELAKRLRGRFETEMDGNGWLEVSSDGMPLCRVKYNGNCIVNDNPYLSEEYLGKIAEVQNDLLTVKEYLPPRVKRIVDEIVDELAKDERVSSAYALWQELREQLCIDYNQIPPQRVPLSQQKEFKTVRNMVIRETLRLSEMHFTFEDDAISDEPKEPPVPPDPNAERMIHQRARFYRRAKSILDAADADPSEKSMALVTLHRLWEEGYTIAAHQLGKAYRDGLGISIDRKAAAEWFQKSAEAGNTCSAYALGKLLLEQEQFPQAIHWLRQAAEQNDPYAQYRLGKLLLTGAEGVPKDVDAAIQLLKDSAAQGNQFAQYTLGNSICWGRRCRQTVWKLCAISHRRRHRATPTRSILSTIRRTFSVQRWEPLSFGCSIR